MVYATETSPVAALARFDAPVQRALHDTLRGDIDNSKPQTAAPEQRATTDVPA